MPGHLSSRRPGPGVSPRPGGRAGGASRPDREEPSRRRYGPGCRVRRRPSGRTLSRGCDNPAGPPSVPAGCALRLRSRHDQRERGRRDAAPAVGRGRTDGSGYGPLPPWHGPSGVDRLASRLVAGRVRSVVRRRCRGGRPASRRPVPDQASGPALCRCRGPPHHAGVGGGRQCGDVVDLAQRRRSRVHPGCAGGSAPRRGSVRGADQPPRPGGERAVGSRCGTASRAIAVPLSLPESATAPGSGGAPRRMRPVGGAHTL